MNIYTYRLVNDADGIAAWIDVNESPTIYQPHHPDAELVDGNGSWESEAAAETWVKAHIEQLKENDAVAQLREQHVQRVMKAITEQGAEAVFAKIEATE